MPATFLVIGAMKAGTSSVRAHLRSHPAIAVSRLNEPHFFVAELNGSRGSDWYRSQFDLTRPLRGDISTSYSKCRTFAGVPERVRAANAGMRLVYLLRDPVDRVVSHYRHNVASGRERRSVAAALERIDSSNGYVEASLYAMQIEAWREHFPAESLLILTTDEFAADAAGTMRRIFRHVGADPDHVPPQLERKLHPGHAKRAPTRLTRRLTTSRAGAAVRAVVGPLVESRVPSVHLPDATRARLVECLAADVTRLKALAGRDFPGWPGAPVP